MVTPHVLAYRKDLFNKNGITPPKTFEEMRTAAKKLQDAEGMKYPIALPWLATGDIGTAYRSALSSLGKFYVDPATKKPNFDTPEAGKAFEEMKALKPYMDPQVTTFDQPKVQQQLFNGTAAMGIMFSGRMIDLTKAENTKFADAFGFAAPPAVLDGGKTFGLVGGRLVDSVQHQAGPGPALRGDRVIGERRCVQSRDPGGVPGAQGPGPERLPVRQGRRRGHCQPERAGSSTVAPADQQCHPGHRH